jgi:hypothetical protein
MSFGELVRALQKEAQLEQSLMHLGVDQNQADCTRGLWQSETFVTALGETIP